MANHSWLGSHVLAQCIACDIAIWLLLCIAIIQLQACHGLACPFHLIMPHHAELQPQMTVGFEKSLTCAC